MANKTHIEYEKIVEKNCRSAIKRLIDNNPLLSEEQKNTLYLYQDFLESKQIQIYTSVRGKERELRALTSYQSLLTYIREIVNFGEFIEKKFEDAKREDVDNYRTYLKRNSSEERAKKKEEKKFALSKVKIKRNPLARKDNTNETFISQYAIEMYSNLIKRFYLWLYNRDNLFKGEIPYLVSHLQKRVFKWF